MSYRACVREGEKGEGRLESGRRGGGAGAAEWANRRAPPPPSGLGASSDRANEGGHTAECMASRKRQETRDPGGGFEPSTK